MYEDIFSSFGTKQPSAFFQHDGMVPCLQVPQNGFHSLIPLDILLGQGADPVLAFFTTSWTSFQDGSLILSSFSAVFVLLMFGLAFSACFLIVGLPQECLCIFSGASSRFCFTQQCFGESDGVFVFVEIFCSPYPSSYFECFRNFFALHMMKV